MKDSLGNAVTRRGFGRAMATAGIGALGAAALRADDQPAPPPAGGGASRDDHVHQAADKHGGSDAYFPVQELPFHLQHEFMHAISCNNVVARAGEVDFGDEDTHAVQQQPGTFGWGTITFFLRLDPSLVGQEMAFLSTVGWNGRAEGEVMFSVEINGDVVIDGARSKKNEWMQVQRILPVKTEEMRVTLMVDSIRGDNNFSFWWGEPQLATGGGGQPRSDEHEHHDDERPPQPEQQPEQQPAAPSPGR